MATSIKTTLTDPGWLRAKGDYGEVARQIAKGGFVEVDAESETMLLNTEDVLYVVATPE